MSKTIDANYWIRSFFQEFEENPDVKRSYEKYKVRQRSPGVEWTHIMGVFLAHLAERMGCFQEWEIGTDFAWFLDASPIPVVSIEHENTPGKVEDEIRKLLSQASRLKVLITYAPSRREIAQRVKKQLTEVEEELRRNVGEFLLLVGDDEERGPTFWEATIFEWRNGELKHQDLENIITDFYTGRFSGPPFQGERRE